MFKCNRQCNWLRQAWPSSLKGTCKNFTSKVLLRAKFSGEISEADKEELRDKYIVNHYRFQNLTKFFVGLYKNFGLYFKKAANSFCARHSF